MSFRPQKTAPFLGEDVFIGVHLIYNYKSGSIDLFLTSMLLPVVFNLAVRESFCQGLITNYTELKLQGLEAFFNCKNSCTLPK